MDQNYVNSLLNIIARQRDAAVNDLALAQAELVSVKAELDAARGIPPVASDPPAEEPAVAGPATIATSPEPSV